jgi:hypothetical protein
MGGSGMHGINVAVAILVGNVITESVSNDNMCAHHVVQEQQNFKAQHAYICTSC